MKFVFKIIVKIAFRAVQKLRSESLKLYSGECIPDPPPERKWLSPYYWPTKPLDLGFDTAVRALADYPLNSLSYDPWDSSLPTR